MLSFPERILFVGALVAALYLALRKFTQKARLVASGRPVSRWDHPGRRIGSAIARVLFQTPVIANRPVTGFFHAFIFWGFFVFALVTLHHVAEGFISGFHLLGRGLLGEAILFGANLFAGLILLSVVYFFLRRYVFRAKGLDRPSWQSLTILSFILLLMVSFLFFEAFKAYPQSPAATANFLSARAAALLPAGLAPTPVVVWTRLLWWLHILIVMAFGVFIMYSKHLHLIVGPINILFRNLGVKAELPLVDLENQEAFGTQKITDLTRKDLLDLFSCAECGRCEDVCPAFQSGKALSPKQLLSKLKEHLIDSAPALSGDREALKNLFEGVVGEQEVWDCTTCGACMEVCPMANEHIAKIMGMRQYAVLMESKFPEEFQNLYRGLENQGNPWGLGAATRTDWAEGLSVPTLAEKGQADVLLWVGCAGSFDQHSQKIARATVEILTRAGVDFATLGAEETCCGDPARRSGMEYLYQILARQNVETLGKYKFQTILTFCPHCYHVLKNEYPQLDGRFAVVHHAEYIRDLIAAGRVTLRAGDPLVATFHDPCYLGRYNGLFQEPRQVVDAMTGTRRQEMAGHGPTSFCCGAGGGGMWKEEKTGQRISQLRVRQAADTRAGTLVTACPYCSIMFHDAIADTGLTGLETADLAQLVAERLS